MPQTIYIENGAVTATGSRDLPIDKAHDALFVSAHQAVRCDLCGVSTFEPQKVDARFPSIRRGGTKRVNACPDCVSNDKHIVRVVTL